MHKKANHKSRIPDENIETPLYRTKKQQFTMFLNIDYT